MSVRQCLPLAAISPRGGGKGSCSRQNSIESKDLASPTIMEDMDLFYYKQLANSLQVGTGV